MSFFYARSSFFGVCHFGGSLPPSPASSEMAAAAWSATRLRLDCCALNHKGNKTHRRRCRFAFCCLAKRLGLFTQSRATLSIYFPSVFVFTLLHFFCRAGCIVSLLVVVVVVFFFFCLFSVYIYTYESRSSLILLRWQSLRVVEPMKSGQPGRAVNSVCAPFLSRSLAHFLRLLSQTEISEQKPQQPSA